ncbi:Glutamyl-tRNA(Gln) amidotransferase subunit A [archaeon HR06]|nr:Glutamyl-tRNA(Gln) amidotransferase subunit A [archaeon HR06]
MEEVNLPYVEYMRSLTLLIMASEISSFHEDFKAEDYGEYVRGRLELGKIIYATEYIKAQRIRALMYKEFLKVMKKIDIIVTPTTPIVAPKIGQKSVNIDGKEFNVRAIIPIFTSPFNLLGFPAISLPCGFSSSGLPIGIQMVGRPFEEDTVLRVAEAYEKSTEWFKREP